MSAITDFNEKLLRPVNERLRENAGGNAKLFETYEYLVKLKQEIDEAVSYAAAARLIFKDVIKSADVSVEIKKQIMNL